MLTLRKNENNDEHNRYFFLWVRKSFRPWSLLQPFLSCSTCMIGTEKPAEFHCMKGPQFQTCQLFPSHSRHVYGYDCLAIFNVFHCKCVYVLMPCQKQRIFLQVLLLSLHLLKTLSRTFNLVPLFLVSTNTLHPGFPDLSIKKATSVFAWLVLDLPGNV